MKPGQSRYRAVAVVISMFILWLVLGAVQDAAGLIAGIAVAAAIGAWAVLAES